jgi:hypothetical protein
MLPSSLLDNQYFMLSRKDPNGAFTYGCPCRVDWIEETAEWLADYDMEWKPAGLGLLTTNFSDTNTLLMFKLAFAGSLSHKCRH